MIQTFWQAVGLAVFVTMTLLIVSVLLFDWWLDSHGLGTISEYSRNNPWVAWLLLSSIEFGVVGLAIHFMGTNQ